MEPILSESSEMTGNTVMQHSYLLWFAGCSLGIRDQRIIQLLHRILWLKFAHSLKELHFHNNSPVTILNKNPGLVNCYPLLFLLHSNSCYY